MWLGASLRGHFSAQLLSPLARDNSRQTYYEEDECDSRAAYVQNNEGASDSPAPVI